MSTTTILYSFDNDIAKEKLVELVKSDGQVRNIHISDDMVDDLNSSLSDLRNEYKSNSYNDVFFDYLKNIYLILGSSQSLIINSAVGESQHYQELESIVYYYAVPMIDEGIPTKPGFIDIYSKINNNDVEQIAHKFSQEYEYDDVDGKEMIIETLQYLRPLVKSLKDNPNSFLIVMHDYSFPELLPKEADQLIDKQIKNILDVYSHDVNFIKFLELK